MLPDTLTATFHQTARKYANKPAIQYKKDGQYTAITYTEWEEMSHAVAKGLMKLGIRDQDPSEAPGVGDRVAILSATRMEWVVCDQGITAAGAVNTAIYDTLSAPQARYIINNSGSVIIFVSDEIQLKKVLEVLPECPQLAHIIVFDPFDSKLKSGKVMSFADFLALGRKEKTDDELNQRIAKQTKDKLAALIYTSGTTADPKGVMLTHYNFMSNVQSVLSVMPITEEDVTLSFLPLSHSFERTVGYFSMIGAGATISYAQSIDTIGDNMKEVHPTLIPSVPRLYEKMYAKIKAGSAAAPPLKQKIGKWVFGVGARFNAVRDSGQTPGFFLQLQHNLADHLVFSKVKAATGGRLRFFVSGGAPLSAEIAKFFYTAGVLILEGYGLTETAPVTNCNRYDQYKFGTVGPAIPGVEVKIAGDGEILMKGPNIMKGYWKKPEDTAEVLESNGWFHSGDIGEIDKDGFLKITDRKKELIIMSNGKNVPPAPLENSLKTQRLISMAIVLGDNRKFMAALLCPDAETVPKFAEEKGITGKSLKELIKDSTVLAEFNAEVQEAMKPFARFESIKKFAVVNRDFLMDMDELTPTLKLKRRNILKNFAKEIEGIYDSGE